MLLEARDATEVAAATANVSVGSVAGRSDVGAGAHVGLSKAAEEPPGPQPGRGVG